MKMVSGIPAESFLAHICEDRPLPTAAGEELPRQVMVPAWDEQRSERVSLPATLVSIDSGNDAFKGTMLPAKEARICTKRIITAYVAARTIHAGEGVATWQVNGSEAFQIGTDALVTPRTESLPIGGTVQRLADPRLRPFLYVCLVELLIIAGYVLPNEAYQGEHTLYTSFGIPNEELDLQGISKPTRQAMCSLLGSGSLGQDGPLSIVAVKKEEQTRLVPDHQLGKRQRHAHKTGQTLVQRVVPTLDMSRFSGLFAHSEVLFIGNHRSIGRPEICEAAPLSILLWKSFPQPLTRLFASIPPRHRPPLAGSFDRGQSTPRSRALF